MKLFYGIIFLSVLCSCAMTDKRNKVFYDSKDDVLDAAFGRYLGLSIRQDKEYGGIIYRDGEGYFYTFAPGLPKTGVLAFSPQKFSGSVVAMWHTHGNSDSGFSEQDKITADKQCIDSYMMNKTDKLFLYKGCG